VDVESSVSEQLDQAMRHTYNLLWAASDNNVPRFVFLSSLSILDQYEEDMTVTERWRPTPTTDPVILGYHLVSCP
jgi:nucleoside-diphosphate-sugar epimerase